MSRGPGTNEEQIVVLKQKLGKDGVEAAEALVESEGTDVIALAYKLTRQNVQKKLPKTVRDLIKKLPAKDGYEVLNKLMAVWQDSPKKR
jgi:hypothetical protein